jgi:hypothetical protein
MIRNFFLLFILTAYTSCMMAYSVAGVYKKPKREDPASVKKYLGDKKYDGLYIVKNDTLFKYFIDSFGASVPNVFIFNKAGQNIFHSKTCVWSNVNELDSLSASGAWSVKPGLTNEKLSKKLSLIDGTTPGGSNDFIIYYVWAKYSPRLSKQMLAAMRKDYDQRKEHVYIGNINLDMQKQ